MGDESAPLGPEKYGQINGRRETDKSRLLTLQGLDGRTAAYRETKQLISEIQSDLGGSESISAMERQMVQHGAVLPAD